MKPSGISNFLSDIFFDLIFVVSDSNRNSRTEPVAGDGGAVSVVDTLCRPYCINSICCMSYH